MKTEEVNNNKPKLNNLETINFHKKKNRLNR